MVSRETIQTNFNLCGEYRRRPDWRVNQQLQIFNLIYTYRRPGMGYFYWALRRNTAWGSYKEVVKYFGNFRISRVVVTVMLNFKDQQIR